MISVTKGRPELSTGELADSRSQTGKPASGGQRYAPFAFTEHGAIMAATVLNSPRAIEASVHVVRAFVRLREALASNQELAAIHLAPDRLRHPEGQQEQTPGRALETTIAATAPGRTSAAGTSGQ